MSEPSQIVNCWRLLSGTHLLSPQAQDSKCYMLDAPTSEPQAYRASKEVAKDGLEPRAKTLNISALSCLQVCRGLRGMRVVRCPQGSTRKFFFISGVGSSLLREGTRSTREVFEVHTSQPNSR